MRLLLTLQPALRASVAARRQPQRGRRREKSRKKARRASSSSEGTGAGRRWVDRGWPTSATGTAFTTPRTALGGPRRPAGGGPGSEVSPVHLLQHVDVEGLVGHDPLQPGVLALELLEALGVVGLHAAVLVAPAMEGRLGDLEVPAHLLDGLCPGPRACRPRPACGSPARACAAGSSSVLSSSSHLGIGLAQGVDQFTGIRSDSDGTASRRQPRDSGWGSGPIGRGKASPPPRRGRRRPRCRLTD